MTTPCRVLMHGWRVLTRMDSFKYLRLWWNTLQQQQSFRTRCLCGSATEGRQHILLHRSQLGVLHSHLFQPGHTLATLFAVNLSVLLAPHYESDVSPMSVHHGSQSCFRSSLSFPSPLVTVNHIVVLQVFNGKHSIKTGSMRPEQNQGSM